MADACRRPLGLQPARWRDPNLDDSGRLGPRPVQCRGFGDDPLEANWSSQIFKATLLVTSGCLDRDLDVHGGGHETRVTEGLMHH